MPSDQILSYRAELLNRLERQPSELAEVMGTIPEAEWGRRRAPNGDSLHQVVAHVRDLEVLAFLPRLRRILTENDPVLEAFPSHIWSAEDYRADEPMAAILADFTQARATALPLIRPLTPEDWTRTGFHPPSGWRTAQWWAERMYTHAQAHLMEIRRAGMT